MVSAVLFITFFVLLVLNVPISVCLGLSSAAAILYSGTSLTNCCNQHLLRYQ